MRPWESARVAEAERETEPRVESLLAESEQERKAVLPVERREESRTAENPTRSGPQESLADAAVERSREPARTERSWTEWSWPSATGLR